MSVVEEAAKLTRVRGGHKAYATKIISNVEELISSDARNKVKMSTYLKILQDRKKIDNDILVKLKDDEIEAEILSSGDYMMKIEETLFLLADALEDLSEDAEDKKRSVAMPALEGDDHHSLSMSGVKTAKLPKLVLKSFSGDILRFTEFWECFDSAVHPDSQLNKVTKFNYLRSLLEGDASAVISGLLLTADNYDEAVGLLRSRYGNKQVLISSHIDNLLSLKPVPSSSDVKRLRELHDIIEINVRNLKNLEVESTHYGTILVSIVMSKLPDDIKLINSRFMSPTSFEENEKEWRIDELMKFLEREIESREMCFHVATNSNKTNKKAVTESFTSFSLHAGTENEVTNTCVYCEKKHFSLKCSTVTDIAIRRNILQKKGLCYVCLRGKHISRNCTVKYKCAKCNGRHNISICDPSRERRGQQDADDKEKKPKLPNGETVRVSSTVVDVSGSESIGKK